MPNDRTSNARSTPVVGGIAIFAGLIISISIFSVPGLGKELKYIISNLIIVFLFFGVKNDILALDPIKKLVGQVVAALLIAIMGDGRIRHFQGFQGTEEINYVMSICCSFFIGLAN